MAEDNPNGVRCSVCGWKVTVPRRGAGQPFDVAMAFHSFQTKHFDFSFPVDSTDVPVITEGELKMGAVYMAGIREGVRQERSRILDAVYRPEV